MWNGTGMAAAWADGHSPPPGLGRSADRSATALSSSASEAAGAGEVAVCAAVGPSSAEDGPVFCNDCCTWLNSRPQWLDHYFGRIHRKTVMRLALMNGDPDDPVHVRWCDLQDAVDKGWLPDGTTKAVRAANITGAPKTDLTVTTERIALHNARLGDTVFSVSSSGHSHGDLVQTTEEPVDDCSGPTSVLHSLAQNASIPA